ERKAHRCGLPRALPLVLRPCQSVWNIPPRYAGAHSPGGFIMIAITRPSAKKKAKELAKLLRPEHPDYAYLKSVFRELRRELDIEVPRTPKRLPAVPIEEELRAFYQQVWHCRKFADLVLIKTLFYTGVRVSELVNIRISDVDLERCQIRIQHG